MVSKKMAKIEDSNDNTTLLFLSDSIYNAIADGNLSECVQLCNALKDKVEKRMFGDKKNVQPEKSPDV